MAGSNVPFVPNVQGAQQNWAREFQRLDEVTRQLKQQIEQQASTITALTARVKALET